VGPQGIPGDSGDQYTFETVEQAQLTTIPSSVNYISVFVNEHIINYKREDGATALVTGGGNRWQFAGGVIAFNLSVTIPDDYPNFQTAIEKLSVLTPLAGVNITIRQRTETPITTAVSLSGGDYSHFVLSMTPSFNSSSPDANKLTVGSGFPANTPAFTFTRCLAPRIGFCLDCANIATTGFNLSNAKIEWVGTTGLFIDNARYNGGESPDGCGIFANNNSDVYASGLRVRNSGRRNLHLTGSSRIKSHNSSWLNSSDINVFVSRGCLADFSAGVTVTGGTYGVIIRRSVGALDNIVIRDCSFAGISSESGSTVGARGANVQNCPNGVMSLRGGRVDVGEGTVRFNGTDLRVETGGSITCSSTTTTSSSGSPSLANTNVAGFNRFDSKGFILTSSASDQGDTINSNAQSFTGEKTFLTSIKSPFFNPSTALTTAPNRGYYAHASGELAVATNSTRVLTFRNDGNIHTGSSMPSIFVDTTSGCRLNPDGTFSASCSGGAALSLQRSASDGVIAYFLRNTTPVGSISVTASSTSYATSSDYRIKENVISLSNAISRLNQLSVYRFNFISTPNQVVDGFLAHEVQDIVPEAVVGEKDAIDEEGNLIYQGIDQSKLVPLLTKALQEAIERIEVLEQKIISTESVE
jgi:hypothetical protein